MSFERYTHIEGWGRSEVEGIEAGTCYVFPKIDGCCTSIWTDSPYNILIHCASRNQEITDSTALQGFPDYIRNHKDLPSMVRENPQYRFFGEFLIPHTLKGYREDAWKKFYIFDVYHTEQGYLSYPVYQPMLEHYGVDYIPPQKIITNGNEEDFITELQNNHFLMAEEGGIGEGIVIKNYGFVNKYGRQCFAKMKTNEYLAAHHRVMGAPETEKHPIEAIIAESLDPDVVQKVFVNITHGETAQFNSRDIPRLLETVWHDWILEEIYQIYKKHHGPTLNLKMLQKYIYNQVKIYLPEIFGAYKEK